MDGLGGPVEQLAAGLRELRDKAGKPGYRQMAARANYSVATLSAAASGRRLPTLEVTLGYVAACDGDLQQWERRWREAERLSAASVLDPVAGAKVQERSPYPGLASFRPEDAELFFGRSALVDELVRRLGQRRFLAVFGRSGIGKSSLVQAGLIPAVGEPALLLTPGVHPMAELAVHLARHAGVPAGGLLDDLNKEPARASLLVRQGLAGTPPGVDLLVVVDQFEEVFAAGVDPVERADFVAALLAMCREPDGRARVVLAVRADYYARFTGHPELAAALTDAQVLIDGMSPAELREAVTGPAALRGARVEGALVATIVAEVSESPGALPLAAHALREAWHRRQGAMVTLTGYQATGGVAGAVARTAEQTYERLSVTERAVARLVLLRMVDVGPDGLVTRRRLELAELDTIEPAPAVIEAFTAARLISAGRDTAEIAHEALIRAWPRLSGWVEESRTGIRLHRQLTEATAAWVSLGRDEGALYRGLQLSAALEGMEAGVIEPAGAERQFLESGRALRDRDTRRHRRRTRRLVAGLAAVLAVVSVLAAGAVVSARRATAERDRAVARELAAGARAERMTDPELALLLAQRAYRLRPDDETESVLRQATTDARSTVTMDAHSAEVYSVAISGSQVASADMTGLVKVWDLYGRTPPVTAPVRGHFVDFGPDGRLAIASADWLGGNSQVVLWRPGDSGPARRFALTMPARPSRIAYSTDGRWIAVVGDDSHVYVWDTTRPGSPTSLGYTGGSSALAFGPRGQLVLASDDNTVRIWNVAATRPPIMIRLPEDLFPTAVAVSPDGRGIAVGGAGKVMVWPAGGRSGPRLYRSPEHWYTSVAFSPDGRRIAAGTSERTIRIWDASDSTRGLVLRGHRGAVRALAFGADGRRLVSGSDDFTARVWDTTADPLVSLPASHGTTVLSPDGRFALASTEPGTISVFSTRNPQNATKLRNAQSGLLFPAVSANGRGVAAAALDEQIRWWRPGAGDEPEILECRRRLNQATSNEVALSGDGRVLAVNCGDGEIRVWRAEAGQLAARIRGFGPMAINRDATLMAIQTDANGMVLWDLAAGRTRRTLTVQTGPDDRVGFSPDGRLLAVAGADGAIRIWTVSGNDDPVVLTGTVGTTEAISFSPDGRLIVGAGTDDITRLWNTDGSGEAIILDHPADAQQIAFSADGRQLIALHAETSVRFTSCEVCGPISEVLALAGQRTTRGFTPEERARYLRVAGPDRHPVSE